MADFHIDFDYKEGSANKCEYNICCRDWPKSDKQSGSAGRWGDYGCDVPVRTMRAILEYIHNNQATLQPEFITWTGDNAAHDTYEQNTELVTRYSQIITETWRDIAGDNSNLVWYPTQGNHDAFPQNIQDFS